jgi:hypothetical protein
MVDRALTTVTAAAREDLRRAATLPVRQPSDMGTVLAHPLRHRSGPWTCCSPGYPTAWSTPRSAADPDCEDGLFEGDLPAVVETARLWLTSANVTCEQLRECLDNANVAVGGLAETPREVP